jgi:hypothetical protein
MSSPRNDEPERHVDTIKIRLADFDVVVGILKPSLILEGRIQLTFIFHYKLHLISLKFTLMSDIVRVGHPDDGLVQHQKDHKRKE